MGEIALVDGRKCAKKCLSTELKASPTMSKITVKWAILSSDVRNCAELPETVSETQKQTKNAIFDAQNGGKMGFLKPNLVENARQMGEIALKNDLQQS